MKTTVFILLLGVVIVANLFYRANDKQAITINVDNCNLQKTTCTAHITDDINIIFDINPKPIPLVKTLDLYVKLNGLNADEIKTNIIGTNMEMGVLSYKLKKSSSGLFVGKAALGICTVRKMQWLAKVYIKTTKENYIVNFPFATLNP